MTRARTIFGWTLTAALIGAACAAERSPPAKSAAPPADAPAKTEMEPGYPRPHEEAPVVSDATGSTTTAPGMPAQGVPAPAPAPTSAPSDANDRRARALRAARTEVEQAQRDLEASMSDCANACRALGSMERATGHLCDLATDHDDRRRCEDAKTAVLRAREKIRAACGSCPNGPSLDKTAPIPSRP